MIESYFIHILILIGIYLIFALSLQLVLGFTGILNFGHIAFFAIGAYVSALLMLNGLPFMVAILLAGIISAICGFLFSIPINKLKGDYVALATLSFSFVIYAVALNWTSLTRGALGLHNIPKPEIFGFSFSSNISFLILTVLICIISYFVINRVVSSPFGKALEAVRDNELAARVIGKSAFKLKSVALVVSAFFAGIAGSLFAHYITYIDPSSFTIIQLTPILCIVIIGGLASLRGTLIATVILVLLPESLRFIGFSSQIVGPMRQIVYSLLLLLILIYKPKGLYGRIKLD
ncbi:branched-chain amino acid ABC transporter permease [Patescibacteria group bacterium]